MRSFGGLSNTASSPSFVEGRGRIYDACGDNRPRPLKHRPMCHSPLNDKIAQCLTPRQKHYFLNIQGIAWSVLCWFLMIFLCLVDPKNHGILWLFCFDFQWVHHVKFFQKPRTTLGFCRFFTCWVVVKLIKIYSKIIWKTDQTIVSFVDHNLSPKLIQNCPKLV